MLNQAVWTVVNPLSTLHFETGSMLLVFRLSSIVSLYQSDVMCRFTGDYGFQCSTMNDPGWYCRLFQMGFKPKCSQTQIGLKNGWERVTLVID